jgi:exosome complex component RRP4
MNGAAEGAEQRLVTPGEVIGTSLDKRAGIGVLSQGEGMIATRLGWVRENNDTISIDPINSRYTPRSGDLVIGIIEAVRNNLWFADVLGPFNGLLPMSLAPWKVEFGAARQFMDVGDVILARVQEVDESHSVVLTMKGVGLRKLKEGVMSSVPMNLVSKIKGENDENLRALSAASDCRVIVGENGRIWADGNSKGVDLVRKVINLVTKEGHKNTFQQSLSDMIGNTPGGDE